MRFPWIGLGLLVVGCQPGSDDDTADAQPTWTAAWGAASPVMRRLTVDEYQGAVADLLGVQVVTPVEPDVVVNGMRALGTTTSSISARGVEQYEAAAFAAAGAALADPELRTRLVTCVPKGEVDDACFEQITEAFGLRAWRRPLISEEVTRVAARMHDAATVLGTFDDGVQYGVATMLQSPSFLFRVEEGVVGDDGVRRYTSWEMATRLSFLLWDAQPDDELLQAAAADELVTVAGLSAQVERMWEDPRARRYAKGGGLGGLASFFTDAYGLFELDQLSKDPLIFEAMSATLGPSAKEQTLRDLEALVFDRDDDFRTVFTSRTTHLNRELAAIYNVPAPTRAGFGETELPNDGVRRGLLGQVSFLAVAAHPTSTSPTRRGKYVRERVLCQKVPSAPADVNTAIPEPSGTTPTLRDRVAEHLTDPFCANCHRLMDPIGLGFENFDGVGRWRAKDNDVTIDATGDLDGRDYTNSWELAQLVAESSAAPKCLVRQLFSYALGRSPDDADDDALDYLNETFAWSGYRVRHLVTELILSPVFREVSTVDLTEPDTDTEASE